MKIFVQLQKEGPSLIIVLFHCDNFNWPMAMVIKKMDNEGYKDGKKIQFLAISCSTKKHINSGCLKKSKLTGDVGLTLGSG